MPRTLAHVTPEVLRWARESLGLALEDAADRMDVPAERLAEAEAGERLLTLRQAERAADVYERPLATFFLTGPPHEEPQETQMRRLPGAPPPPWPPAMQALVRRIRERQEAAVELHDLLEEPPLWPAMSRKLVADRPLLATVARQALGVRYDEQTRWRDYTGYTPLRRWIDAVESLGILVMQDGSMPVGVMRGFAAVHTGVPVIAINTKDDARSRAYSVIHELGHLVLTLLGDPPERQSEEWCEDFAGETIMPTHWLERELRKNAWRSTIDQIDELAIAFGVTPLAAAVRLARTQLLPQQQVDDAIDRIKPRPHRESAAGGNYYLSQIGRFGPAYLRLVFDAVASEALTYPVASTLLDGVKVNNFGKLRTELERRGER